MTVGGHPSDGARHAQPWKTASLKGIGSDALYRRELRRQVGPCFMTSDYEPMQSEKNPKRNAVFTQRAPPFLEKFQLQ
ncbi:unnamed protein product [Soboliphyme baturini]|uniref:Uncharacterized protein n=1 Tax=Soboliphyme baturini TaxID=241478 RepID=A0A183IEB4_9BILA|nr:unnamed protein product [Soboliphyme baturini]